MTSLRALTLWPEHAFCVAHLHKDRENRKQRPPRTIIGEWLAIHAGANIGGRSGKAAHKAGMLAMFETCERITGALPQLDLMVDKLVKSVVVAVVKIGPDPERGPAWRWYLGEPWLGWKIEECRTLATPVKYGPGQQGIWFLPNDIADAVLAQIAKVPQ